MGISYNENSRFKQGVYKPENPKKYIGSGFPIFRSSYELAFMRFLDSNPNILEWNSEGLAIPYFNPLTGKGAKYYPDFIVKYKNHLGEEKIEIVEIKPSRQSKEPSKHGNKKRETLLKESRVWAVNQAKWDAAKKFCEARGIFFRVITEKELKI